MYETYFINSDISEPYNSGLLFTNSKRFVDLTRDKIKFNLIVKIGINTRYSVAVAKLEISNRGSKTYIQKISIKPGVKNVYTQKLLYENTILSTNERKVRGSAAPSRPHKATPLFGSLLIKFHLDKPLISNK
ncbi:hypothetical protein Hanom_Chr10g00879631 [Helianthus anomalus]